MTEAASVFHAAKWLRWHKNPTTHDVQPEWSRINTTSYCNLWLPLKYNITLKYNDLTNHIIYDIHNIRSLTHYITEYDI